LETPNKHN
jgi:NADH:ubiquinone oxidoreductase subunit B-like Fe-S oxidoreductase